MDSLVGLFAGLIVIAGVPMIVLLWTYAGKRWPKSKIIQLFDRLPGGTLPHP